VQLTDHAGEGRLATLVGAGDDQDPLGAVKGEIIGDNRRALGHELVRKGQVDGLLGEDVSGLRGDLRAAKARPAAWNRWCPRLNLVYGRSSVSGRRPTRPRGRSRWGR
jgi:hypothetical protein